jgi:pilus assembly protein CpaB
MILMVVAVVCGLGASYMTSRLLAERDEQPPPQAAPEVVKVKLLVARKALPLGQTIKTPKDLFVEKQVTRDDAPKDAVNDPKMLEGKTLRRSLRAGDHIFADDIKEGPVTLEVPPGMRAVGLRVTVEAIAAGFASLPGSKVDILFNMRGNNADTTFSMKLLQNVLVLAADTTDGQVDTRAMPASVVTLALTPKDAERVSLATENGTLRLVLRQPGDEKVYSQERTTLADILGKKGPKEEEVTEEQPPEGRQPDRMDPKVVQELPEGTEPEEHMWEPIPAPQRKQHVVWYRDGNRVWKEVFDLEETDSEDDVPSEAPQAAAAPAAPPRAPIPPLLQGPAVEAGRAKGG